MDGRWSRSMNGERLANNYWGREGEEEGRGKRRKRKREKGKGSR